jgi:multiple sugar transport system ATP-binding protein
MAEIVLDRITKSYGSLQILHELDLTVQDGEFLILVGESGCGKSTTLRIIAGLEAATSGSVRIGGRDVTALPPGERNCAMVFQSYALYPHMTVRDNIAFGLRLRGASRADRDRAAAAAAETLSLGALLDRYPRELSGGQRQRVAIGRAIVRRPDAFLFDEPLSNLDAKLRIEMRSEIKELHERLEATMVYVTHDQVEAMTMADRVVVMEKGRVSQVAPPLSSVRLR